MRMIDANKFRRFAHEQLENDKLYSADDILEMIDEQSTAYNVEEVVKEVQDIGTRFCTTVHCNNECENCDHGSIMKAVIDAVRKGGVKNE